jgi:hypothetical protein
MTYVVQVITKVTPGLKTTQRPVHLHLSNFPECPAFFAHDRGPGKRFVAQRADRPAPGQACFKQEEAAQVLN